MKLNRVFVVFTIIFLLLGASMPADAARRSRAKQKKAAPVKKEATAKAVERAPEASLFCIEAQSGLVIFEQNADIKRPPASMLKMMLMVLASEGIRDGKWTLDTPITIKKHAENMGGTQVYVKEGEVFSVNSLMSAVCVASANDAAMAIAEGLFGSEEECKKRMNARAAELGMSQTVFNSVHGLPPAAGQPPDVTTARDMARLGQFCVLDPQIMAWVGQKEIVFRPGAEPRQSTNKLLGQMPDCDGIKTGFTNGAGFCITATAKRQDIRLIAVVMGEDSKSERFDMAKDILEKCFAQVSRKRIVARGDPVGSPFNVANCETEKTRLVAAEDLMMVVKNDDVARLEITIPEAPPYLEAPLPANTPLMQASVQLDGKELARVPVMCSAELPAAGWRWKLTRALRPRSDADASPTPAK